MSTDKTLEIVKEFTDRIYIKKWIKEGAHRNYAYSLAKYDYILSLDSDERLTPELKEEITAIFKAGPAYFGYNISWWLEKTNTSSRKTIDKAFYGISVDEA
jgi:glycosyltransferase involved in cell wall biosynthesis